MQRTLTVLMAAAAVLAALVFGRLPGATQGLHSLTYQGKRIRLSKTYQNYEEYKLDPANLDTNELSRIERLMTQLTIGPEFRSIEDFYNQVVSAVKFPGYGCNFLGKEQQPDGSVLEVVEVEIPQRGRSRVFAVHQRDASTVLLDDVVTDWPPESTFGLTVRLSGGKLTYLSKDGDVLRSVAVAPAQIGMQRLP